MKNTISSKTQLPVITSFLVALSLLLYLCHDAGTIFQYDRTLIEGGELWRIGTGHFTHWSFEHFLWCTLTFSALGYVCEDISPRGYLATLGLASIFIPAVLWLADTAPQMYRGSSGLASSIFVFGALMMMRRAFRARDWSRFYLAAAAGFGYLAKILYEFASGCTVFVETSELFAPVPLVHLAGGLAGLLVVLVCINKPHRQTMRPVYRKLCATKHVHG